MVSEARTHLASGAYVRNFTGGREGREEKEG